MRIVKKKIAALANKLSRGVLFQYNGRIHQMVARHTSQIVAVTLETGDKITIPRDSEVYPYPHFRVDNMDTFQSLAVGDTFQSDKVSGVWMKVIPFDINSEANLEEDNVVIAVKVGQDGVIYRDTLKDSSIVTKTTIELVIS